jgi:hypothetical protein
MMKPLTCILSLFLLCFDLGVADLRMASQPKKGFKVRHMSRRRQIKFNASFALYMEPSDFEYAGLIKQRDQGAYDNFLRSNIDNQQDRRNFDNEDGKDHLPFRSFEGAATDASATQKNKIPADFPGTNITVNFANGRFEQKLVPLRWNNPHSAELEVNIWIMKTSAGALAAPLVVPILKPTCSGEGYQDQAFTFTVPSDFNNLGTKIQNFKGCKEVGDCVLQVYAHSVESRQYAIGVPLLVMGTVPAATAQNNNQITKLNDVQLQDPGMDITGLRTLCRPRSDAAARITTAQPREARLISDVYNHAYQNSDYSPYSGQQPREISQNLQASCILKMVPGNRGELGQRALLKDNLEGFNFQRKLDRKAKKLVKQYEKIANSIIKMIEGKDTNSDLMGPAENQQQELVMQQSEVCFRCNEVGSTTTRRLTTQTYIPSFQITDQTLLNAVKVLVEGTDYAKVMDLDTGLVQIYVTALKDLMPEFEKAYALNITYQGPMVKSTLATMADTTNFKKRDENGATGDKGLYAARQAYAQHGFPPWKTVPTCGVLASTAAAPCISNIGSAVATPMAAALSQECPYSATGDCYMPATAAQVTDIADELDMHGVMVDADCDDPDAPNVDTMECTTPTKALFSEPIDLEAEVLGVGQGTVADGAFGLRNCMTTVGLVVLSCLFSLH